MEIATFGKILGNNSTFRCSGSLASYRSGSWNVLITGPSSWGFDVLLATALCKNLPAENTQPTRVAVPIEEEEGESVMLAATFNRRRESENGALIGQGNT